MRLTISTIFFVCAACTSVTSPQAPQYGASSVLSDFESGKLHEGQLVSVSGFLTFGDDKHNIWEGRKEYEYIKKEMPKRNDPAWGKCISLINYGKFRSRLTKYDERQVKITGYIYRKRSNIDEINFGSCSDVSISLEGDGVSVSAL